MATFQARLTGYYPSDSQMEGGFNDRAGHPLHTLESAQAGDSPWVSVSGDDAIWPYGQRISIDIWPGITFRIVDLGCNFSSVKRAKCPAGKQIREPGREPLDICVADEAASVRVPSHATATIVDGDNFDNGKPVNYALLGQSNGGWRDWVPAGAVGFLFTVGSAFL